MKKKLRTWLSGVRLGFPTAFSPYWQVVPLGRMKTFLAGYFFIGAAGGFALDLLQLNASSIWGGLFWPVLVGTGAAAARATVINRLRLVPLLLLLMVVTAWLGYRASQIPRPRPVAVAEHRRVLRDAIGILLGVGFGTRLLLLFAGTEGLASVRMQTELSLAHGIQATLVPTISFRNASFELYGKSIPSTEMGGDLIDVIESDGGLVACVADISGHGLPSRPAHGDVEGCHATRRAIPPNARRSPRKCGPRAARSQGT